MIRYDNHNQNTSWLLRISWIMRAVGTAFRLDAEPRAGLDLDPDIPGDSRWDAGLALEAAARGGRAREGEEGQPPCIEDRTTLSRHPFR